MAVAQHNEHSFDLDLLLSAKNPVAIDVGCRGFSIARQLLPLMTSGVRVFSLDIDDVFPEFKDIDQDRYLGHNNPAFGFRRRAIMGESDLLAIGAFSVDRETGVLVGVQHCSDPAATCICKFRVGMPHSVATTMRRFLKEIDVARVDLLKLDCEGSEYGIMEDLARADKPLARQITVEYHDHCGKMPPGGSMWFDQIARLLSRNYEIVKHQRETPPWGGQPSYVDCLYIAREW